MFDAGAPCYLDVGNGAKGCCPTGFGCDADAASLTGRSCKQLGAAQQSFKVAKALGACVQQIQPGGVCGEFHGAC
jgi:hypothetical protein